MEIKPMLAVSNTGAGGRQPVDPVRLLQSGDWIAEEKLDGIRAWISPNGKIFSRTGVDITHKFPEAKAPPYWLDGEILAESGDFETTLLRESQESPAAIKRMAERHPCRFWAFDAPGVDAPWEDRHALVTSYWSMPTWSNRPEFLDKIRDRGGEGVILKRIASKYQPGKRSGDWIKVKFTRRFSCIAYGYSPGQGSRARFGAMMLALLDNDDVAVPVGRCGSGFTERQIDHLKERLDRGEPLVVDIEFLNFTPGRQLRHPVFRGVRRDVDIADCTFDQH